MDESETIRFYVQRILDFSFLNTPSAISYMVLQLIMLLLHLLSQTPARLRCDIVKQIGEEFRIKLTALSRLVSIEVGMVLTEAIAEVQVCFITSRI